MKATNIWNLKAGDIVRLTYYQGDILDLKVERVTEKSWWCPGRNSFGTLASYMNNAGDIVKCEIIKG